MAHDRYFEEVHRALMRCYARQGNAAGRLGATGAWSSCWARNWAPRPRRRLPGSTSACAEAKTL